MRFKTVCVGLILCFAVAAVQAGPLEKALKQMATPSIAGSAHRVENFDLRMGQSRFHLDGVLAPLKVDTDTIGFVFSGEGTVETRVAPGPFEQANLSNLDEKFGSASAKKAKYEDSFKGAVFLLNWSPENLLRGPEAEGEKLAEVLSERLGEWKLSPYSGIEHFLAMELFNRLPGKSAIILMEGGRKDLVYQLDEAEQQTEMLAVWKKARGPKKVFIMSPFIRQGAGFDPKKRPLPSLALTSIDLELSSPDNEMLDEKATLQVRAGKSGLILLAFGILNGQSEHFEFWNEREDPFTVDSVATADGKALEFSHQYDELLVMLPELLAPGETTTIVVHAKGRLLKNYYGDNYTVLGNMAYYPQLQTEATAAPFHAVVKVRDPWVALACGKNLRRWKEGDLNCLESREEKPVSFPFVVVGKFNESDVEKGGYDLKVYSYAGAKKRGTKNLQRNGLAILDFYSHGMVPFAYRELEIVEIPYYRHFFWQSPAGIVEITSEGFNPVASDSSDVNSLIKRYAKKGQNARLAHEIAHQWFGNLASWATPYDNWLSESFAEYLSYMFMSMGAKKSSKAKEQLHQWKIDTDECSEKSSIYGASALAFGNCYTQLLYGKGPYVLHALRHEMGDEKFTKLLFFLTKAAEEKQLKVSTEDVIQFASAIGGKDYRPFFDRYVYGTEVPEIPGR